MSEIPPVKPEEEASGPYGETTLPEQPAPAGEAVPDDEAEPSVIWAEAPEGMGPLPAEPELLPPVPDIPDDWFRPLPPADDQGGPLPGAPEPSTFAADDTYAVDDTYAGMETSVPEMETSETDTSEAELPETDTSERETAETAETVSAAPRRALEEPPRPLTSTVGWTILGSVIPGVGLIRAGHRVAGGVITGVFVLLVGTLVYLAGFANRGQLANWALSSSSVLIGAMIVLLALGLAWVAVIAVSHLCLRSAHPPTGQRVVGAVVVGVLSMAVMAPSAVGAAYSYTTLDALSVFASDDDNQSATVPTAVPVNATNPWESTPRLNVLILGGDSDKGRAIGNGDRTDTVIVASIDTTTGATTLISLPRNTARMPFPPDSPLHAYFPNGYYDGHDPADPFYMLNAMYRIIPDKVPKDILGKKSNLSTDALKLSVGYALGLDIDYYVMVNMDGFRDLINAVGGININVNYKVPIGGVTDKKIPPSGWIDPGPNQHLTGYYALWYARGRYGLNDYSRMERQRCVINAVAQQASPMTILTRYESIAAAGKRMVRTDIPRSRLAAFVTLAERIQGTTLRSIVFENGKDGFRSGNPDFAKMKSRVKAALKETTATNATASPSPSVSAPPSSPGASATPSKSPKPAAAKSDNLDDACAYHPNK